MDFQPFRLQGRWPYSVVGPYLVGISREISSRDGATTDIATIAIFVFGDVETLSASVSCPHRVGHKDAWACGPAHGYAVIEEIRRRSGGAFDLPEGTIYPALHRLEQAGLLRSSWTTADSGRRRRVYTLTRTGNRALVERRAVWKQFSDAIGGLLGGSRPRENPA